MSLDKQPHQQSAGEPGSGTASSKTVVAVSPGSSAVIDRVKGIQRLAEDQRRDRLDEAIAAGAEPVVEARPRRVAHVCEFPSHLARVPLFRIGREREPFRMPDNPEITQTPWGSTKRHGPGINTQDELTLAALMYLCGTEKITGPRKMLARRGNLSVVTPEKADDDQERRIIESWSLQQIELVSGRTNAREICELLGDARGGTQRRARRDSVNRLREQRLTHYVVKGTRMVRPSIYVPPWCVDETGAFKTDFEFDDRFFVYAGDPDIEGDFGITWSESMSVMMKHYTLLDLDVAGQLGPMGFALYKYLSSMMSGRVNLFTIRFHKLALYLKYGDRLYNLKRLLIPEEIIRSICANKDWDQSEKQLRALQIDWREFKRMIRLAIVELNKVNKRFTVTLVDVGRGETPQIQVIP